MNIVKNHVYHQWWSHHDHGQPIILYNKRPVLPWTRFANLAINPHRNHDADHHDADHYDADHQSPVSPA